MPIGHLTSGSRTVEAGLERYVFEVSTIGVAAMAERAQGNEDVSKMIVAGWCMTSPRPDPRDIMSISMKPSPTEPSRMELTVIIRRGHYTLAQLINDHTGDIQIKSSGEVTCSCHPGQKSWLIRSALPTYHI